MNTPEASPPLHQRAIGRWVAKLMARTGLTRAAVIVCLAAGVVVTVAGVGFTKLTDDVMERDGVTGADHTIERFAVQHRTAMLTDVFRVVTHLGGVGVVAPLAVGVVLLLLWQRRIALAFGVMVATGGVAAITAVTKLLVARSRPPLHLQLVTAHGAAFPSGHSAEAVVCYGVLAWVVIELVASRPIQVVACVTAGVVALAVGFSRIYLGVHWASDVVSGWVVGVAWLAVTIVGSVVVAGLVGMRVGRTDAEPSALSSLP
jgi:PAP2 superfamily protein